MYNPFTLLTEPILINKIKTGKRYFVRQTYQRGKMPGDRAAFLIRAYDQNEEDIAHKHLQSLKNDTLAFLYDITDEQHLEKMQIAASQPEGFKVYYAGKKGKEWKPPISYQFKLQKYISKNHPDWRTKSKEQKIEIGLHEEFGQLFLKFRFKGAEEQIPFDEIEKY